MSFPSLPPEADTLVIPANHTAFLALDTGTYMSAVIASVDPSHICYVHFEFPNYHYVADEIAHLDISLTEWAATVADRCHKLHLKPRGWADQNSQFKVELLRHGITVLSNFTAPETRTAIAREYIRNQRVWFQPWVVTLPHELELAHWPKSGESQTGRFSRVKKSDHTLDCLEHILSKRPRGATAKTEKVRHKLRDRILASYNQTSHAGRDPHLGHHF